MANLPKARLRMKVFGLNPCHLWPIQLMSVCLLFLLVRLKSLKSKVLSTVIPAPVICERQSSIFCVETIKIPTVSILPELEFEVDGLDDGVIGARMLPTVTEPVIVTPWSPSASQLKTPGLVNVNGLDAWLSTISPVLNLVSPSGPLTSMMRS